MSSGCGSGVTTVPPNPVLTFSATSLTFPSGSLGVTSAAQTVTVTNSGGQSATVSNIATTGDFAQSSPNCSTLAVNASCQISVTFTPTAFGTRTGTLTVTSNGTGSPQTVALSGADPNPVLTFSASSLTFPSGSLGVTSAAQTVTVTNSGGQSATVSNIATTGDFAQSSPNCTTLAVNASCKISVTFTPTASGTRTGTLTVTSNGAGSPQTVALSGVGVIPQLTLSATTLTFASTISGLSSSAQTITVTSTGAGPLTISGITTSGDFSQQSFGCTGAGIAVGSTCEVLVIFNPTATGTRTGSLSFTSNAPSSPQTVALTGTATPAVPILSLSTPALTFGTLTTGMSSAPAMITATNLGSAPLLLSNIAISGDFTQTSSGCAASIAGRASCQIFVTFSPAAAGTRTGALTVTNNATANPQSISLSGTGVAPSIFAGSSLQATVLAGTKPIAGAAVQLYAAGTSGNGSAPTALLPIAMTTNAAGMVTIPAGYVCPSAGIPVYLVSRGGTVAGASAPNANIALLTAIGPCNGTAANATFVIDEATTVAGIDALAQFYAMGGAIGATASNPTGLANAFATAATLADPVAGTSPGSTLPANAVSPAARVDSLANLLNACVTSASACNALYTSTTQGTTVASNTMDALYLLAKNPAQSVAALFTQSQASMAYAPVLLNSPVDWTMFINYSGGGMDNPSGIGVDSKGNVWVSSYFGAASEFTPLGAPIFPNGITGFGLNNSYGLAIDLSDNVWIPNEQPFTSVGIGSISELSPSGASLAGNGYLNGGLDYPLSIAIDPNGTVWTVDYGDSSLTLLNPSGTPISGTSGYTSPLFAFPVAVAVDANHFGWVVNQSSDFVTRVAEDGSHFTNYDCCDLASGIAIDQGDNIWVANYFGDTVSLVTNPGTVISRSFTGLGSIYHPQGIAIDGAGTVWVANYRAPYLTELSGSTSAMPGTSLSPAAGLGADAGLLEAYALALDASGNIWVTNQGNNTITKLIGLAVPVKTPLSGLPQLP